MPDPKYSPLRYGLIKLFGKDMTRGEHSVLLLGEDEVRLFELTTILARSGLKSVRSHGGRIPKRIDLVVYDSRPGCEIWKTILSDICIPAGVPMIVTSWTADDRLWSEVLHHGGYDVLAQPFDANEVTRAVNSALGRNRGRAACASC